ncbi:hypothetical protein QWY76_04985 [Halomonas maura]|nr:hypothetical protein [Halomonas maura]
MNDATATPAGEGFSAARNRKCLVARKRMTHDPERGMAKHAEVSQETGVALRV